MAPIRLSGLSKKETKTKERKEKERSRGDHFGEDWRLEMEVRIKSLFIVFIYEVLKNNEKLLYMFKVTKCRGYKGSSFVSLV